MKKVLFTATVDSHILAFHIPFLKYFKDKGYAVHVATNGKEKIPYCDKKHVISFERNPLKIKNLKAIKHLKKVLEKEEYDLIHTNTPMGSVITRLAVKKLKKEKRPRVIYMAHGLHFYKGANLKNWLLFYPVEKYLSKFTDTLILINKEDYNLTKRKFKKCKNIEYVPGVGIDEDKFKTKLSCEEKEQLRKTLGLSMNDFIMIYPAELNKNKNQTMLIKAMESLVKKYSNIHLLLPGEDSFHGFHKKEVKKRNLEKNIHFLGFRKDIPNLLKITDLAVATSKREGLPVNIMEAMTEGLPIVATNVRGHKDLIENGKNGFLVELNDVKQMQEKIEILYSKKEIYKQMQEENKKRSKQYKLEIIIDKMKEIYEKKQKVLHLLASNSFSGAENVICTIIEATKDDYDHFYCSPNGQIKEKLKEKKIPFCALKKLNHREVLKKIKEIKPDIIHAHDNKATVIASFFHKKARIISHIHGNNKIMNSKNLKTIVFNHCTKKIEKMIWVSDSSLKEYYFYNNVKEKSIVLYNIVNQKDILEKVNLYPVKEKYDLIFLGRLAYPKNPERFIELVKLIKERKKNIKVAIVGTGTEQEQINTMISRYNLEKNIIMYGFQSNPYPILNAAKILVMTSIYEGTPMCALEAQTLGKPIIATPVDGLKKIIKNNVNGYLSNENEEICHKILEYLEDDVKMNQIQKNVKKEFEKYNDLQKYMKTIEECYEVKK